jgi:transposase-like protein
MPSILSAKHFHDERAAYAFVEARVWANGRVCPHCGVVDNSTALKGKSTRPGVYKCKEKACRKPFTVKVGTVFEASNVKLHIWLQAMHLLCSSKKGISSNQLHRTLGVTLKTAWFMSHRIREAMRGGELAPFGSGGSFVEVDETFLLRDPDAEPGKTRNPNWNEKMKVLTLVDRASGRARSFVVDSLKSADLAPILTANIAKEARLLTDEAPRYISLGRMFADHQTVNHGKEEYVSKADPVVHTNTVENFYSVFKRGMRGTYQHCAKRHLHRYAAEFDFRYSNRVALGVDDQERAEIALRGIVGRRLTYRQPDLRSQAA